MGCQAAAPPTHLGVHLIHKYSCVLATGKFMEACYKLSLKIWYTYTFYCLHTEKQFVDDSDF